MFEEDATAFAGEYRQGQRDGRTVIGSRVFARLTKRTASAVSLHGVYQWSQRPGYASLLG